MALRAGAAKHAPELLRRLHGGDGDEQALNQLTWH
jgi:hypothetical protein